MLSVLLPDQNILKDFQDTRYTEEIYFNIYEAYYLLAIKSISQKKGERIDEAFKAYINFAKEFGICLIGFSRGNKATIYSK